MGSLGLQRSWGCHGKFGRPNCMRLVGREAVDRTAVFVCRPKDAANHTWGASGLCASGLLYCWTRLWWLVWVASAVERDISTASIRQGRDSIQRAVKRPETI